MSKRWFLLILWMAFLPLSCKKAVLPTTPVECEQLQVPVGHLKKQELENLISKYVKKGLPGISLLVQDANGYFVGSAGFADIEKKIPFSACHISKAASITKLTVGTLALMLQEEGKLNIDDPLDKYIDNKILSQLDGAKGKTIRQLMNHTTGIYDLITSSDFYLAVLNNPDKNWTQEELLKFAYGKKAYTLNNPYPAWYSNTNTLLLSMCIEKATGIPHHRLLRDKLFNPLGMASTYYQGRETIPSSAAQGYFDLHNNGRIVNVSNLITGSGNGYGGLYSNVFDLHRFLNALLVNKTLLSDSSLQQMTTFVQEDEDFFTGAGTIKKFTKKKHYAIGHTGRDLGYSANLFYFPETGSIMIFFVNYGTNGNSNLKPVFLDFESDLADLMLE
jgi:D-alanyl-D-alanine carboxypeptidase